MLTVMHERLRDQLLAAWGRGVCERPRLVVAIGLILAAASVWLAATRMEFQADRNRLIDADVPWNAAFAEFRQQYPRWDDIVVVVDVERTGDETVARLFVRTLAQRLRGESSVASVIDGFESTPATTRLILSRPEADYQDDWAQMQRSLPVVRSRSLTQLLSASMAALSSRKQDAGGEGGGARSGGGAVPAGDAVKDLADFTSLIDRINAVGMGSLRSVLAGAESWQPIRSESGRLLFMFVAAADGGTGVASETPAALAAIRSHISDLRGQSTFDKVRAGVTGLRAIEEDETQQSIRDSTLTSIVAGVVIIGLIVWVFRGWVAPLLAMASLLVGIAWSFGYLTLVVGHLQVLSVVFTVMLLGLGIDFASHLMARLQLTLDPHDRPGDAFSRVFRGIGPGLLTGAVTIAAAFAVTALTDFKGVGEMGIIAGGGILLCLIAVLSLFPAALALLPDWKRPIHPRSGGEAAHFAHDYLNWVNRYPVATLVGVGVATTALAAAATRVHFDPNILRLQARGAESVRWEQRILNDSDRSAWAALDVVGSMEEAERHTLAFIASPDVSTVEGVGLLFHPDREQRRLEAVQAFGTGAQAGQPGSANEAAVLLGAIHLGISAAILERSDIDLPTRAAMDRLSNSIDKLAVRLADETVDATRNERARDVFWRSAEVAYAADREGLIARWNALVDPAPPSLEDLPSFVRTMSVGRDGSLLLRINPASSDGRSVLEPDRLEQFVSSMRGVLEGLGVPGGELMGPPVQIYESSRLIVRAYVQAAFQAVGIIAIILLLDYRSMADTLCAFLPVTIGFVGMFGMISIAGVPLNFANIIVLPVIFGIGVASGVYLVHRWRLEPEGIPRGLSGGTGRGMTLSMLTTIIAFSSLMLARHQGIRDLGFTMTAGLIVTLLSCYTALPAVLRLRPARAVGAELLAER